MREPLHDGALASELDSLRAALDRAPQRDRNFLHDFEPRDDHFLDDRHDQRVTLPTDVGRTIDEAVHAAPANLDLLPAKRRIHERRTSLDTGADAHGGRAPLPGADTQSLGGERNSYRFCFAYVQRLG